MCVGPLEKQIIKANEMKRVIHIDICLLFTSKGPHVVCDP